MGYAESINRHPWLWIVVIGIPLVGVIALGSVVVRGDDGNTGSTAYESTIHTVEVCPSVDTCPVRSSVPTVAEVYEQWGAKAYWWDMNVVLVSAEACLEPVTPGRARWQLCSEAVPPQDGGDFLCTGKGRPLDGSGGTTRTFKDSGQRVERAYVAVEHCSDRAEDEMLHEAGHTYGLALRYPDGRDGHDQHDTRIMSRDGGSSWAGLEAADPDELDVVWLP